MIFSQTWQLVMSSSKTQTRRLAQKMRGIGWLEHVTIIRDGQTIKKVSLDDILPSDTITAVVSTNSRTTKWQVGKDYAVQPGRNVSGLYFDVSAGDGLYYHRTPGGGLSVWDAASLDRANLPKNLKYIPGRHIGARIEIKAIRLERLQDITEADAKAEGVNPLQVVESVEVTTIPPYRAHKYGLSYREGFRVLWGSVHKKPGTRWADNPLVFVLEFERVV